MYLATRDLQKPGELKQTGKNNMRSGSKNRRSRGRGNGGRWGNTPRNHNFESNGPDGKVRGTAQQVVDKYQALAREATTAGDPFKAEGYFQFGTLFACFDDTKR